MDEHKDKEHSHEAHSHHETHDSHSHDTSHTHQHNDAGQEHSAHEHRPTHTAKPLVHKKSEHAKHVAHEKKPAKASYLRYLPWAVCTVLAIVVIILLWPKGADKPEGSSGTGATNGSADVTFYVMSQCPYGTQVEDAIEPVLTKLGDDVNFRLEFIGNDDGAGNFQSLHGEPEVVGDKIHLCVQKYYPDELIKFVVCQNKNVQDLTGTIDSCAKTAGIDTAKIKTCYQGAEGSSLLSESFRKSQAAGASGSPTIYINGNLYQSARDATSFQRAICQGLSGNSECGDLPACSTDMDCTGQQGKVGICNNPGEKDATCTYKDDSKVTLTVVNAKACTNCDSSQLVGIFRNMFLNLEVKEVYDTDSEGKTLVTKYSLQKAPAYIFTGDVTSTYAWKNNQRLSEAFTKSGSAYVVKDDASGSTYILDAKKRAELEKITGVTKGDNKPQIDFYVMSYCPYGNQAEEGIEPAYQLLKDKAEFNPHYVIYSNYQGGGPNYCLDSESKYCSMHGIQELNQNIRELCVDKYMGIDEYFSFVLAMNKECTASNADTCWEDVAKDLGLDTAKIKSCEKDEGETLVANELKLDEALGVRGSPTIFVEGSAYAGDRSPRGYATALCAGFDTAPSECSASKLAALEGADTQSAAAAGSC